MSVMCPCCGHQTAEPADWSINDLPGDQQVLVALILEESAWMVNTTVDELVGPVRSRGPLWVARQIAAAAIREQLGLSFAKIARLLGRFDHSSARHAYLRGRADHIYEIDQVTAAVTTPGPRRRRETNTRRSPMTNDFTPDAVSLEAIDAAIGGLDGQLSKFDDEIASAQTRVDELRAAAEKITDERARLIAARDILTGERPVPKPYKPRTSTPITTDRSGGFTCTDCGKSFKSAAGLGGHRKIHGPGSPSTAKPPTSVVPKPSGDFDCPEPGCDFRSITRADMARHRRELDHYTEVDDDGNPLEGDEAA